MDSDVIETIHVSTTDLTCPICLKKYGLSSHEPISIRCGHILCSVCLGKASVCPHCGLKIPSKKSTYMKNVFVSSIIEQREKAKECKIHHRSLEFYCKDHKQLLCVDCAIEGNHFSHDFLQIKGINTKAKKLKTLMEKFDQEDEKSFQKLKAFMGQEKTGVKRRLDSIFDGYLGPFQEIRKKLHKEVDAFTITQRKTFEIKSSRNELLKFKEEIEGLTDQWEGKKKAEIAGRIVEVSNESIEKKINNEIMVGLIKEKTKKSVKRVLQNLRTQMDAAKESLKQVNSKANQVMVMFPSKGSQSVEKEYLVQFLMEFGMTLEWVKKESLDVLEIEEQKRDLNLMDFHTKCMGFECNLERLHIVVKKATAMQFKILCRMLGKMIQLEEVGMRLSGMMSEDLESLAEAIQKLKGLTVLKLTIDCDFAEKSLKRFLQVIEELPKLQNFESVFKITKGKTKMEVEWGFRKPQVQKRLKIGFSFCEKALPNDVFSSFLQNFPNLSDLTKFQFVVSNCLAWNYEIIEPISTHILSSPNIEELSISLEGAINHLHHEPFVVFENNFLKLKKLKKLDFSFAQSGSLASSFFIKFLARIVPQIEGLKELGMNFSSCASFTDHALEKLGDAVAQFEHLGKLSLECRRCPISEKGLLEFGSLISKVESLRSLTVDYQFCMEDNLEGHKKIEECFNGIKGLTEKKILNTVKSNQEVRIRPPALDTALARLQRRAEALESPTLGNDVFFRNHGQNQFDFFDFSEIFPHNDPEESVSFSNDYSFLEEDDDSSDDSDD